MVVQLIARALGEEDLAPAARLTDTRGAMDVEAEVRPVADVRLSRMHPHADAKLDPRRPVVIDKRLLGAENGVGGGTRIREDDEELVAPLVDDDPVPVLHGSAEEAPVVVEDMRVAVAQTLDELRRPLDIREDKRDCSMRKIRHGRLLQGDLGTDTGSGTWGAFDLQPSAQRGHAVGKTPQS